MLTTRGETYELKVYKRKPNSAYEYEDNPYIYFRGRPANQIEKKNYRLMSGVNGNSDSVYILATNLPSDISIKDRVYFLGKFWTIESIGFYFDNNLIINGKVFSDEYLIARSPKGIVLQ